MHTIFDKFGGFRRSGLAVFGAVLTLMAVVTGCKTHAPSQSPDQSASAMTDSSTAMPAAATPVSRGSTNSLILQSGDNIKVSFPGAPNLDAITTIRVDGKISLPMIGEIPAAGLTPTQLEKDVLKIADPQLVVKEVSVTVVTSAFEVYVSGAVLRPGKLVTDRVITPLEAVMEAGLDYQRGNLKNVHIVRKLENGQTENFKLNLKKTLNGQSSEPFALHQYDIIYVPERFNWF